jgi:hypothetical protein
MRTRINDPIVDIKTSRKANSPTDVSETERDRFIEFAIPCSVAEPHFEVRR